MTLYMNFQEDKKKVTSVTVVSLNVGLKKEISLSQPSGWEMQEGGDKGVYVYV